MRFTQLIAFLAVCFTGVGCAYIYGPREQVKAFANDKDDLILAISKKVEPAPNLAGVAEAQKLVDAKKDSLQAQRQAIYNANPGIISNWRSTLLDTQINDRKMFQTINLKLMTDCKDSREDVRKKFAEVEDSFNKATKLPGEI